MHQLMAELCYISHNKLHFQDQMAVHVLQISLFWAVQVQYFLLSGNFLAGLTVRNLLILVDELIFCKGLSPLPTGFTIVSTSDSLYSSSAFCIFLFSAECGLSFLATILTSKVVSLNLSSLSELFHQFVVFLLLHLLHFLSVSY